MDTTGIGPLNAASLYQRSIIASWDAFSILPFSLTALKRSLSSCAPRLSLTAVVVFVLDEDVVRDEAMVYLQIYICER